MHPPRMVQVAVATGVFCAGVALAIAAVQAGPAGPYALLAVGVAPLFFIFTPASLRLPIAVVGVFATFVAGSVALVGPLGVTEAVIFLVATAAVLGRLAAGNTPLPWSPLLWWPLLLLMWTIVSLPSSLDLAVAFKQVAQLTAGIVFATVVYAACGDLRNVRFVLGGLVGVSCVFAGWGVVTANTSSLSPAYSGAFEGRVQAIFVDPNQLGSFCALAALAALALVFGARTQRGRLAAMLAVPVLVTGLLLSLSRGAWIGLGAGVVALLVMVPQARRALLFAAVPVVIAGALLGSFATDRPEVKAIQERASSLTLLSRYDERAKIWAEAQREISERPLLGVGPGNFPVASRKATSETNYVRAEHAHNIWLNWGAEAGLPAIALLALFVVAIARAVRRARRSMVDRRGAALLGGLAAALTSVLGHGLLDYPYRNVVLFFMIWALVGLLLAANRMTQVTLWTGRVWNRPVA